MITWLLLKLLVRVWMRIVVILSFEGFGGKWGFGWLILCRTIGDVGVDWEMG